MTTPVHESYPDPHHDTYSKTVFGFWVYLLTDFVMFATLFAVYAVLRKGTYGGPTGRDLVSHPFVLTQTVLLLTASYTAGLGGAMAHRKNKNATLLLFFITFLLGLAFIGMEFADLTQLVRGGNGWQRSAFLSAHFSLIGTHMIHMVFALLWVLVLMVPLYRYGFDSHILQRLTCLRMFWQFLNIIWAFIFTLVYMVVGI